MVLPYNDIQTCWKLASIGLVANKDELTIKALPLFVDLVKSSPEFRDTGVSEHEMKQMVDFMASRHKDIYPLALRFVSEVYSGNTPHLIDLGIGYGVLQNYESLLQSTEVTLVKESLWGLSNITASNSSHVAAFFD